MYFWRLVGEVIGKADIILILGDARMPEMSRNEKLEEIIANEKKTTMRHKEVVRVFTKRDLASKTQLDNARKEFPDAFFVASTKNEGIGPLRKQLLILAKRMKLHSPKVGVVGYPNVGKSALINVLARGARAAVADKPGTTRGIQWINAGPLRILDSPGVIPINDRENHLAMIGAKHVEKLRNPLKLAENIVKHILSIRPAAFIERYGLTQEEVKLEPYEILELIGKKRGFLGKGGIVDENKTAFMIVREWQRGQLQI